MILQRISGSCEGEDAEGMEDGLGAAHREDILQAATGAPVTAPEYRRKPVLAEAIGVSLW